MSFFTAKYDHFIKWLEEKVHVPWIESSGCCTVEIESLSLATYDWQRLGVTEAACSPNQANLLIVAGWINELRAKEIKRAYDQMCEPKLVVAAGSCAISGSPFELQDGVQKIVKAQDIVPVDIFVTGCPPRPEALLLSILSLKKKFKPDRPHREVLYDALRS